MSRHFILCLLVLGIRCDEHLVMIEMHYLTFAVALCLLTFA